MSCKRPLKGFPIGVTKNGKIDYKIVPYGTDHVYRDRVSCEWKMSDHSFIGQREKNIVRDFIEIPCGKCIGCRLKYSRDWASRMVYESLQHENNYFVTFTYSDKYLPVNDYLVEKTGEVGKMPTLRKRDFQLFMKRLRDKFPDYNIRYYCCGEYGGATHRPHYHAILFGLPKLELKPWKRTAQGFWLYNCDVLSSLWHVEKSAKSADQKAAADILGFVVVGEVTFDTCAYVARYVTKKLSTADNPTLFEDYNFEREFSLMSLKPAIGREFFDRHKDELYTFDYMSIPTPDGSKRLFNSKYFDKLLEDENPDKYNKIKEKRKILAESRQVLKQAATSQSYLELLASEEENLKARTKILKRVLD